jgi:hypothetical protein
MEGFLPIFFLLVVLKIPVLGALWLIWYAAKPPDPESSQGDSNGGPSRFRPFPTRPRGPQHGPSGGFARRGRGVPPGQRRLLFRPARDLGRPQPDQAKNPATRGDTPSSPLKPPA